MPSVPWWPVNSCLRLSAVEDLRSLRPAAVADLGDLAGRQHDLHRDHVLARVAEARAQQRPAAGADAPADQRARVRGGVVGIEDAVALELLVELEHVDARPDRDGAVHEVDLVDLVHQLDVDEDAAAQRHGAVGEPGPAGARHDRDAQAVGELDDLRDLLGGGRQHRDVGHVVGPAVDRERRRDARAVDPRAEVGQDAVGVAGDRAQLVEDRVVDRALERDAHGVASRAACVWPPTSMPADCATSSNRSITSSRAASPGLGQRALRPRAGADQRVDLEPLRARHPASADLRGDLRLLDRQPAAAARAVGPLRDVVDVAELDPGHRAQQLARRRVNALALVEPARVVVGDGALDRLGERDPALLDEVVDELDAEHDLELVVVAEVARVVLGERDEVVRVRRDDALRADRAPVGDVVLGVPAGEVDVAHLGGRAAAAPLLAHEPELAPRRPAAAARTRACRRSGRTPPRSRRTGSSRRRPGCRGPRPSRRRAPGRPRRHRAPARCGAPPAARSTASSPRARCRSRPSARASP